MIQTAIYSFGASLLTAIWLGAGFLEAGTIASAISALNAALWHLPFLAHSIRRRRASRLQMNAMYALADDMACPKCGNHTLEVTSAHTIDCSTTGCGFGIQTPEI